MLLRGRGGGGGGRGQLYCITRNFVYPIKETASSYVLTHRMSTGTLTQAFRFWCYPYVTLFKMVKSNELFGLVPTSNITINHKGRYVTYVGNAER